ncbi:F-box-like domain protein [Ceratobasidium sp. AG-Ba]|nr:F-box-like domain protein [Ceratobasidium sp. AG-Ba]
MASLDLPPDDCPDARRRARTTPLLASLLGRFKRTPDPKPSPLPCEVYRMIIAAFISSLIDQRSVRQYRIRDGILEQKKALVSVRLVSRMFLELVWVCWNRHWLEPSLPAPNMLSLVHPVTLFELSTSPRDLSRFTQLRFASLDFGCAFEYSDSTWRPLILTISLPPSLQELEILWSHASEEDTIALVGRLCPNIVALRLVFCTMFNRPRCVWWAGHQHPADHEHYLKGCGLAEVEIYARTVALALGALPNLSSVHLSVYFIPPQAIDAHRTQPLHLRYHPHRDSKRWLNHLHAQNATQFAAMWNAQHPGFPSPDVHIPCLADKGIWEAPCRECVRLWADRVEHAERLAATILAVEAWSLKSVSFGLFVAERRTSPSEWMVCRSTGEDRVWVRARRSGVDCRSVVPMLFQRSGETWVQVEGPM